MRYRNDDSGKTWEYIELQNSKTVQSEVFALPCVCVCVRTLTRMQLMTLTHREFMRVPIASFFFQISGNYLFQFTALSSKNNYN